MEILLMVAECSLAVLPELVIAFSSYLGRVVLFRRFPQGPPIGTTVRGADSG